MTDLSNLSLTYHDWPLGPWVISVSRASEGSPMSLSSSPNEQMLVVPPIPLVGDVLPPPPPPSHTVTRRHGKPRTGNQDSRQASTARLKSLGGQVAQRGGTRCSHSSCALEQTHGERFSPSANKPAWGFPGQFQRRLDDR